MNQLPLITKYRPISFEEVYGNESCIKALSDAVRGSSRPHAYLLTGNTGVGKTTLSRIIASEIDALIEEIDAASHSGVDDTRALVERSQFIPIMGKPAKLVVIDEAHNLSKKGFEPLLKLIEEPPDYLYIALCTTEVDGIPKTIKTRCHPVSLKPLKTTEIEELLITVADLEGWAVVPEVFTAMIQASYGSARMALTILQAGHAVTSRDELAKIIDAVETEGQPVIELCKFLMNGGTSWKRITTLLEQIEDHEAAINIATRYLSVAMARSEESQAHIIWNMLASFAVAPLWDKKVQLYSAIGKIRFGGVPF